MFPMCLYLVAQSCLSLYDPMDCSPLQAPCSWGVLGQEACWGGVVMGSFYIQGSNPGLPTLQADSLTSELPGKPYCNISFMLLYINCNNVNKDSIS